MTATFAVAAAVGAFVFWALAIDSWLCRAKTKEILREAHETLDKAHELLAAATPTFVEVAELPNYAPGKVRGKPTKATR